MTAGKQGKGTFCVGIVEKLTHVQNLIDEAVKQELSVWPDELLRQANEVLDEVKGYFPKPKQAEVVLQLVEV